MVLQKVLSFARKVLEKQNSFSLFFVIVVFDIISLGPAMLKQCNPISEEGSILVLQKIPQRHI